MKEQETRRALLRKLGADLDIMTMLWGEMEGVALITVSTYHRLKGKLLRDKR